MKFIQRYNMKSKILILILALVMAVSALASCGYVTLPDAAADEITLVTVDADAKVEFVVNPDNKVVAATPLNDLASIVIFNESLTDKAPDEAVAQLISLVAKAGLVKNGSVKISVTGESEYSKAITEFISKAAVKSLKKEGIDGEVEKVAPITEDELREFCLEKKYIYEEDAYKYTYKDLIYTLAARRVGYAEFPSQELIYLYELFDETFYNSVIKGETLADVETLKDEFPGTYTAYKVAVDAYKLLAADLDSFFHEYYLAKDSQYQKTLSAYRDERESASAKEAFDKAAEAASAEIEIYREKLDAALESIENIEKTFINEIKLEQHLRQTYNDRLSRVKTELAKINDQFKDKYKDDISFITDELSARKKDLIK